MWRRYPRQSDPPYDEYRTERYGPLYRHRECIILSDFALPYKVWIKDVDSGDILEIERVQLLD